MNYQILFNDIKEYFTQIGHYSPNEDIGYSKDELAQLEIDLGITIGGSFKAYFSTFGKLKTPSSIHKGPLNFINEYFLRRFYEKVGPELVQYYLDDYLALGEDDDEWEKPELEFSSLVQQIKNLWIYNGETLSSPKFSSYNIIFINYDNMNERYEFVTDEPDSPFYFYYWDAKIIKRIPVGTLSCCVRKSLWNYVLTYIGKSETKAKDVLNKIPWLIYYKQNFSNDFLANISIRTEDIVYKRTSFNDSIENKNFIYSIDRYEVEFIRYLINTGEKEYQNDFFNPDDYLDCDFREYLK